MEVICLQSEALYKMIDDVVAYVKEKEKIIEDPWVEQEKAMELLHISSKTTLQRFRDEDRIRFTHSDDKNIVYDRRSISDYLDKKANKPL